MPDSALLIIGNEILSGRTQDVNLRFLAQELGGIGAPLREVRVVPDVEEAVIDAVNHCRKTFSYLFTTGGIGPTHDDITTACIARAFGLPVVMDPEAVRRLTLHYGAENLNPARLKMAAVPQGAALIDNPVSAAPGFRVENVYAMAGVPAIMQAMFASIKHELKGGPPVLSRSVSGHVTEGIIASDLTALAARLAPQVEIGSYPFMQAGKLGVSLVARGTDEAAVNAAAVELEALLAKHEKA